jgi:hypothetical protein
MKALPPKTSELLAALADPTLSEHFDLEELLAGFHQRAFGVFLLAVVLPVLLPIPFGIGALCGPLVCLVGLQLAVRLNKPWMPRRLRQRPLARATLRTFLRRMAPWLRRLERLSRPRIDVLFTGATGNLVTGLLLLVLGAMLALPIPLTNYPFGLLILGFALALIERDGALLLLLWGIALALITSFAGVSMDALQWLQGAIG